MANAQPTPTLLPPECQLAFVACALWEETRLRASPFLEALRQLRAPLTSYGYEPQAAPVSAEGILCIPEPPPEHWSRLWHQIGGRIATLQSTPPALTWQSREIFSEQAAYEQTWQMALTTPPYQASYALRWLQDSKSLETQVASVASRWSPPALRFQPSPFGLPSPAVQLLTYFTVFKLSADTLGAAIRTILCRMPVLFWPHTVPAAQAWSAFREKLQRIYWLADSGHPVDPSIVHELREHEIQLMLEWHASDPADGRILYLRLSPDMPRERVLECVKRFYDEERLAALKVPSAPSKSPWWRDWQEILKRWEDYAERWQDAEEGSQVARRLRGLKGRLRSSARRQNLEADTTAQRRVAFRQWLEAIRREPWWGTPRNN